MPIPIFGYTPRSTSVTPVARTPSMAEIVMDSYHESARLANQNLLQSKSIAEQQRALSQRMAHDTSLQGRREAHDTAMSSERFSQALQVEDVRTQNQYERDINTGTISVLTPEREEQIRGILGDEAVEAGSYMNEEGVRVAHRQLTESYAREESLQRSVPEGGAEAYLSMARSTGDPNVISAVQGLVDSGGRLSREEVPIVTSLIETDLALSAQAANSARNNLEPEDRYPAFFSQYSGGKVVRRYPSGATQELVGENATNAIRLKARAAAGFELTAEEETDLSTLQILGMIDGQTWSQNLVEATRKAVTADATRMGIEYNRMFQTTPETEILTLFPGKEDLTQLEDNEVMVKLNSSLPFAIAADLFANHINAETLAAYVNSMGGIDSVEGALTPGVFRMLRLIDPVNFGEISAEYIRARSGVSANANVPVQPAGARPGAAANPPVPGSVADSTKSVNTLGSTPPIDRLSKLSEADVRPAGAQQLDIDEGAKVLLPAAQGYSRLHKAFLFNLGAGVPMPELGELVTALSDPTTTIRVLRSELDDIKNAIAENDLQDSEVARGNLRALEDLIIEVEQDGAFAPIVADLITRAFVDARTEFYKSTQ